MSRRTLAIGLGLSLLANLFLVFAIAAGVARLRHRPMIAAGGLRVAGSELSPGDRRAFRGALHAARAENRDRIAAGRAARTDAARAIAAAVPDRAAALAALARAREADMAVRAAVEARAVDFAARMPMAERQALARGIVARAERPYPRRR